MNNDILVEELLTKGSKFITKVFNSVIGYKINNTLYELMYVKGEFKEKKPYQLKPLANSSTARFQKSSTTLENSDSDTFFAICYGSENYHVKFLDRVKMAKMVNLMENQIIEYRHKLCNNALDALSK